MPSPVGFVKLRNIRHQRIVWVGIGQQGTNRKQDLADGQRRAPLVFQNIQADTAIGVDIAMIDASSKVDLRWLEWIIGREVNVQKEDTSGIRRVVWTHDSSLPVEHVIAHRTCRAIRWRILSQIDQFCKRHFRNAIVSMTPPDYNACQRVGSLTLVNALQRHFVMFVITVRE